MDKFSHVASFEEIRENDFNLNIPRYVDTFEEEELVDIDEVKQNISQHRGRAGPGTGADETLFGGAGAMSGELANVG